MEKGKRICQALKELRKRIADANNIPFDMDECTHKGDCPGTCPKCEAELQYLMEAIDKLEQEGQPVTLDGIMSDEELRKAFAISPVEHDTPDDDEGPELAGIPAPPDPMILQGEPEVPPLEGDIMPYPTNDFATVMTKALLPKVKSNFVFSPAGLGSVLEILQEGTNANSEIYHRIDELIYGFNSDIKSVEDEDFTLAHAASIWYNQTIGAIKGDFIDNIKEVFEVEVHNADFAQETKTKLWVDKWVSDKTHHLIKRLDTEICKDALLVILDALYMKAKWEEPFDPDLTDTEIFYNADGSESEVDMMYQDIDNAEYSETEEYHVISLPYRDYSHHMIVVLPKKGIDIDSIMSNADWLNEDVEERDVELYMPRFKFDNTLSFKEILTELGLGDMFDEEDSFPCMTDLPAHISEIKQQCVIEVEEEGTEAAAVTMAICGVGCPPPDDMSQKTIVKIDRPFGFAIREYNQILFMGVVKNMSESRQ